MELIEKCKEKEIKGYLKYFFAKNVINAIPVIVAKINKPLSE